MWSPGSPTATYRGRRTRSRGCWATSPRGALRTAWTCTARTAWSMRPAPRPCQRFIWRCWSFRRGVRISCSPVAWTRSTTCSCTPVSRRRPHCRRAGTRARSATMQTGRCSGRAWGSWCSSDSRTPSATVTGSTRCCVGWAPQAMAKARRSTRPHPTVKRVRSGRRTRRRTSSPARSACSRGTGRAPRLATRRSCAAWRRSTGPSLRHNLGARWDPSSR